MTDDIRQSFTDGTVAVKLIYANLAVFLVVIIWSSIGGEWLTNNLTLSTQPGLLLDKPWAIVTYMFTHRDFIHIFFNMMCLYWFGQMLGDFCGEHLVARTYVYGGLAGGLAGVILTLATGQNFNLIGASAATLALMAATATYSPNHLVGVVFIGQVRLKYFALFFAALYMLSMIDSSNIGANAVHIAGMLTGYILATVWKHRGLPADSGSKLTTVWSRKKRSNMHVVHNNYTDDMEFNRRKTERAREVDRILDKIKATGYESLTDNEKRTLFEESKK